MSKSNLTPTQRAHIWIAAGGRCQFPGCNRRLDLDSVLKRDTNVGENAHIVADSEAGPRGDALFSEALGKDPSNIMLLCEEHHKQIDGPDRAGYNVELLRAFKEQHEARVVRLLAMDLTSRSVVVAYHDRIGAHPGVFDAKALNEAVVLNSRYSVFPDRDRPIRIDGDALPYDDSQEHHWLLREAAIRRALEDQIEDVNAMSEVKRVSVFALAAMPDLVMLGKVLGDKRPVDVFQYDRSSKTWLWADTHSEPPIFRFAIPEGVTDQLAISLSLSFEVDQSAITCAVPGVPIARFGVDSPTVDLIKGPADLVEFARAFRRFLVEIARRYGRITLHLFPAAPASTCVELGRLLLPKADNHIVIWDYQRDAGGFVSTVMV